MIWRISVLYIVMNQRVEEGGEDVVVVAVEVEVEEMVGPRL